MSGLKTYGAIAIMIGCFAIVYPRFMHPLLANIFGSGDASRKDGPPQYPPSYKGENPSQRGGGGPEDVRKHMRHGPHPGMRAAAEMQRQQSQQGSGRGMMGVVLPMYAVGIVLYLGYTLYKVFNKTNAKNSGRYAWDKTSRYNSNSGGGDRDRMGFPKDCDGRNSSEIRNFLHDQEHRQNLEDLLTRVDDKNVSVEEMRVLQQRLEETEAQMTRILQAMRGINTNVDNLATGEMGSQAPQEGNNTANGDGSTTESSGPREGGAGADGEDSNGNAGGKDHAAVDGDESEKQGNNGNMMNTTLLDAEDDKEDGDDENTENDNEQQQEDDDNDDDDEVVDEVMPEKNDDDEEDKDATTEVRQRIVKSNEQ